MTIQIEKGVPVPNRTGSGFGAAEKYPWRAMEIGDSFIFPLPEGKSAQAAQAHASNLAASAGKRLGRKYRTSCIGGALRVWRTA